MQETKTYFVAHLCTCKERMMFPKIRKYIFYRKRGRLQNYEHIYEANLRSAEVDSLKKTIGSLRGAKLFL